MKTEYWLIGAAAVGVVGLAIANKVFSKPGEQSFASQAGQALGGSVSEAAGSAIASVPLGAVTGAWQTGQSYGNQLGLNQVGIDLGTWVQQNINNPFYTWTGIDLSVIGL